MNLRRVKKGEHLLWPDWLCSRDQIYRGGEGYVLDLDVLGEAKAVRGQEHKLEPAPAGSAVSKIELAQAKSYFATEASKPHGAASSATVMDKPLPSVAAPKKAKQNA